ncbi:hypothetical protein MTR67_034168 [Solanum verrucosum]|uniref:Uncharacterized protein n=1 Tax=Solanum verrucosum TaxID=315347 RepID=A0AAF0U7R5_SOLVR|nr:hypothetical protein MTR67_034168 [Solanum verrucosum]
MEMGFLGCDRIMGQGPVDAVSRDRRSVGDLPFGQFHRLFALAFIIFMFCNFGRYGTASRNRSVTRRHLLSITDLIFSFRAWHTRTLGEAKAVRRFPQWVRRSSCLLFFVLSLALFPFAQ